MQLLLFSLLLLQVLLLLKLLLGLRLQLRLGVGAVASFSGLRIHAVLCEPHAVLEESVVEARIKVFGALAIALVAVVDVFRGGVDRAQHVANVDEARRRRPELCHGAALVAGLFEFHGALIAVECRLALRLNPGNVGTAAHSTR